MSALLLALSLSNSVTKVGAIAAFLALVGIAVLSLLVFSQAREIKRLRDWAGRAPERAAELEQRVSADAAARLQTDRRSQGSSVGAAAPVPPPGRVVPRRAPLVSAPVSTAVNANAAATPPPGTAGAQPTAAAGAQPAPAAQPGDSSQSAPPTAAGSQTASVESQSAGSQTASEQPAASSGASPAGSPPRSLPPAPTGADTSAGPAVAAPARPPAVAASIEKPSSPPAPATAAARATARSPLPPTPDAPRPATPRAAAIPNARPVSSRAFRQRPAADAAMAGPTGPAATAAGAAMSGGGRKDFRQERSRSRAIVLGVGIAVVAALLSIFVASALKGGSSTPGATRTTAGGGTGAATANGTRRSDRRRAAASPGVTSVVVLNGTATTGLAHHLAADLQQSGYSRALALAAVPPGTHQTTVVEYASGHHADADGVARTLNVTHVEPMDSTIAGMAGSATVVVLAGADQAALLGGGGAQSQGEPAAGSGQ